MSGELIEYLPLAWQTFLIPIISSLITTSCKFIFQQQSTLVQESKITPAISYSFTQNITRNVNIRAMTLSIWVTVEVSNNIPIREN